MMPGNEQRRPAGDPDGISVQVDDLHHSVRHEALGRMLRDLDGALVVLVVTPKATTRRRVFLTLAAAERYADRAAELGHLVRVMLVKLDPVSEVAS